MPILFLCICHGHEPCCNEKQSTSLTVDKVVVRAERVGNIKACKGVVSGWLRGGAGAALTGILPRLDVIPNLPSRNHVVGVQRVDVSSNCCCPCSNLQTRAEQSRTGQPGTILGFSFN